MQKATASGAPVNKAPSTQLTALFDTLRSTSTEAERIALAQSVRELVASHSRESTGDALAKFLQNDVFKRIFELINSAIVSHKLSGISVIEALIDFPAGDNNVKITRFANYLRIALPGSDPQISICASRALGKLAKPGGALISDFVDFEVKRALEWLQGERSESRRYASVLILKELATNCPTLISSFVSQILELVWIPLRDIRFQIRETGAEVLAACLGVINQRVTRLRRHWQISIYVEAERGITTILNPDSLHGCLLAYQTLFVHAKDFMRSKFSGAAESIINLRHHTHVLIRKTVVQLFPVLAAFKPNDFVALYLSVCVDYLVRELKKERAYSVDGTADRTAAFLSIGQISVAVGSFISSYFDSIFVVIRDHLVKSRNNPKEATPVFHCLTMLTKSNAPHLEMRIRSILSLMLATGLSMHLLDTLSQITNGLGALLSVVQDELLAMISKILSDTHSCDFQKIERVVLALDCLRSFDFSGLILHEFLIARVLPFLDHSEPKIRIASVSTCSKLLSRDRSAFEPFGFEFPTFNARRMSKSMLKSMKIAYHVLDKLLAAGIADIDAGVRETAFMSFEIEDIFDGHLGQAENIKLLYMALRDEAFAVRERVARIFIRLGPKNPACVMPLLRTALLHVLKELEYLKVSVKIEESLAVLSILIQATPSLIPVNLNAIIHILLPMTENDNADLSAKAMSVIGKLADSDGGGLLLHYDHIVPLAIAMLQDHSSGNKRLAALITLRKIFNNNCVAISPLLQFSNLLDILLTLLKIEDCTIIRMASLNLIGILGALDPYKHSLLSLPKTKTKEVVLPEVHNSFDEEYYPFVAVSSLLKILNDSSLAIHHSAAIQCLMYMFESLGVLYVLYLPEVVPAFVNILRSCPLHMIEFYLINLTSLVAIFKAHMDIYAKDIIHLVAVIWESNINLDIALLSVVEALSSALEERIADFLPQLMVFICKILERDPDLASFAIQKALRVVTKFGVIISDYLPLILPIFLVLLHKSITQTAIQKVVVESIGNLATYCKMNAFASEVIQSLLREFKSTHSEELQASILDIIVVFAFHLNQEFLPYVSFANKVLLESRFKDHKLSQVISLIVCQKSIPIDYLVKSNHTIDAPKIDLTIQKVFVNQQRLRESWDTSEKSTSEDWAEWMRRLNIELLKETSSHSLRSCSALAAVYNPLARDLFHAAFVSCWKDLDHVGRADLVKALETVLNSATTTPEITQILLNLIEFMELDDNPLPLDIRNLSGYASKCRAWSKALRWKELEFLQTPNATTTESLISINSQLQQYDAAVGILQFIQESGAHLQPAPLWYEKLNRWEDALNAYQHCLLPESAAKLIGQMRCLQHLGEWDQLSYLAKQNWERVGSEARQAIASLAAVSSWTLSDWQFMEQCVGALKEESPDCAFFRAVLAINDGDFPEASRLIEVSRKLLDTELIVLLSESYRRAYHVVVRFQMLTELDEIITLKSLPNGHDKKAKNMCSWSTRLNLCEPSIEVWQRLLRVRSLAANTKSDSEWIKFANLCRKQGNFRLADGTLSRLLLIPKDENGALDVSRNPPSVVYACLKHTWASNGKEGKERAFEEMRQFTMNIIDRLGIESLSEMASLKDSNTEDSEMQMLFKLLARCYLKLGEWQTELEEDLDPPSLIQILKSFSVAKKCDSTWYKAWHRWASANFEALSFYENRPAQEDNTLLSHAIASVEGFSQAITLSSNSLQDTLRLLTVWFKYGGRVQVASTVSRLFDSISIETWLQVVPQLIARIHTPNRRIQELLLELLGRVGHAHPQAVLWSLTVATKSPNIVRANAALSILNAMRLHSPLLVEQALAVSRELVRIAVPWQEAWNEGLVEASQLYFEERNIEGMFDVLEPLHQMIDGERETTAELDFISKFGYDLSKAWDGCKSFIQTRRVADLELAWDYYRRVFREIRNQLHGISSVQLQQVSPSLINYKGLELAMPGTYKSGEPIVRIETFSEHLSVFATKQRPRKLSINGSNGVEYQFLLKGNEDLRQDERVMQLMQLINTLLLRDSETFKRRLSIERYAVVPLSPNSGLIGWVPNCDTIHGFITDHRKSRNIKEDLEYRLMLNLSPNYDNLPLLHKVDVFQQALAQTSGQDLSRVLWQKSRNSEQWLERRNVFGQSLAVMSMVGYVMGLGDRHPKNLMMEKTTGKVVHIDFGDCFEVAMLRNQFPEKVPFRLTRIFVKALGVTGIEGNFRVTSEHVMRVLRNNRDSLMAVLEAFVYDPLVNWRMLNPTASESPPLEDSRVETPEVLNEHAVSVIARVSKKLAGKDFNTRCPLDIPAQVQRLIEEATSLENLCQGFIGWCPFW